VHSVGPLVLLGLLLVAKPVLADDVVQRYPPPQGFQRIGGNDDGFAAFLRTFPLLPASTPVRSHLGEVVAHHYADAVFDLDVGKQDLQQCADSAIRLWAEYVRARHPQRLPQLHFHATNGDDMAFSTYLANQRLRVAGSRLAPVSASFSSDEVRWQSYLSDVFSYAGSRSMGSDTMAAHEVQAGDVLVNPGSPGHVVVVIDVVADERGEKRYLIGQGFMPAQSFHILVDGTGSPWWQAVDGNLLLPSWPTPFSLHSARRFSLPPDKASATSSSAGHP
jgi:Domain of unknown function (4846)